MNAVKLNKKVAYKTIINERGDTVFSAIALLEEIIDYYKLHFLENGNSLILHTDLKDSWKVSYKYFEEKIGFKSHQTRRALLVLEKHNLVKRQINRIPTREVGKEGGTEVSLMLDLKNIENLLEI